MNFFTFSSLCACVCCFLENVSELLWSWLQSWKRVLTVKKMPHRTRPMTALLVFTGLNIVLVSTITPVYDFVCFLPYWERRVCFLSLFVKQIIFQRKKKYGIKILRELSLGWPYACRMHLKTKLDQLFTCITLLASTWCYYIHSLTNLNLDLPGFVSVRSKLSNINVIFVVLIVCWSYG